MDTAPRSGCAINAAVEVLGDPWAMLVLRDIMFGNRRHFRELERTRVLEGDGGVTHLHYRVLR